MMQDEVIRGRVILKLKVGQRVMVFHPKDRSSSSLNKECGTVIGYGVSSTVVAVQFDNFISGHDCDRMGKFGYCWYIPEENLRPISSHVNSTIKSLI